MTSINRVDSPDAHRVANYTRPRGPNASHPNAREPDDTSDLVVKELDHADIWARYNAKAGAIQGVVPAKLEGEDE